MIDLNGWCLDKSKLRCNNVIVYNMDFYWYVMVGGVTLPNLNFYCAEDAVEVAKNYINIEL